MEKEVKQLNALIAPPNSALKEAKAEPKIAEQTEASAEANDGEEEAGLDATQGDFCFFPPETARASSSSSGASGATNKTTQEKQKASSSVRGKSDRAETRSHQPIARLGVDESGEWKFRLEPATQGSDQLFGSHLKPRSIVLCRQSEKRGELGLPFLSS